MARGCRIVNPFNVVEDVDELYLAKDGAVRDITAGYIARNGSICQFWPNTLEPSDVIVLDATAAESYDSSTLTEPPPHAICYYNQQTARLELSLPDGTVKEIQVLNPPPRGIDQYLFRFSPISGTFQTDASFDAWYDVFDRGSLGLFKFWMPNNTNVPGRVIGQADFSIAEDDGAGSPVAGTIVTKTIDFIAEIIGNNFVLTPTAWTIQDDRVNENAGVIILTVPSGYGTAQEAFVTGNKGIEGSAVEVIREIYANDWNSGFKVKVDVVSGAVQGDVTGTFLTTDAIRRWYIATTADGQSVDAVIDLTVTDSQREVTKRITMGCSRGDENSETDLDTQFTRYDKLQDRYLPTGSYTLPEEAAVTLRVTRQGELEAERIQEGVFNEFPQNWNQTAPNVPDPENYECQLRLIDNEKNGDKLYPPSELLNTWLNLSQTRSWTWRRNVIDAPPSTVEEVIAKFYLDIREVGRPSTMLTKEVDIYLYLVSSPDPGGPIP